MFEGLVASDALELAAIGTGGDVEGGGCEGAGCAEDSCGYSEGGEGAGDEFHDGYFPTEGTPEIWGRLLVWNNLFSSMSTECIASLSLL